MHQRGPAGRIGFRGKGVARHRKILTREASNVLGRIVTSREDLNDHFNINKVLKFVQGVYKSTGIELDVNCFYVWPNIKSLARAVRQRQYQDIPKLILLKEGDESVPLFVFAGGASCFLELKNILAGLDFRGAIYGVRQTQFGRHHTAPAVVEDEVEACCHVIEQRFKGVPVRLLGYSFGGVVALELARKLKAAGSEVSFLGLIDTHQSEHAWPLGIWARVVGRKILSRLGKIKAALTSSQRKTSPAVSTTVSLPRKVLARRLSPILFRFYRPTSLRYPEMAPEWVYGHTPKYENAGKQLLRMRGLYQPEAYGEHLVFYRASGLKPQSCDPWDTWHRFLPKAEWSSVRGNHLSAVAGKNGFAIGKDVADRLNMTMTEAPAWDVRLAGAG